MRRLVETELNSSALPSLSTVQSSLAASYPEITSPSSPQSQSLSPPPQPISTSASLLATQEQDHEKDHNETYDASTIKDSSNHKLALTPGMKSSGYWGGISQTCCVAHLYIMFVDL